MEFYKDDSKEITIYNLIPKKEDLMDYREYIISQTDKNTLFKEVECGRKEILERFFKDPNISESAKDAIDIVKEKFRNRQYLLSNYIEGAYDEKPILELTSKYKGVKLFDSLKREYDFHLLQTLENYIIGIEPEVYSDYRYYIMSGLISLPDKLYYLESLLRGNLDNLQGVDFSEQLEMFDVVSEIKCPSNDSVKQLITSYNRDRRVINKILEIKKLG